MEVTPYIPIGISVLSLFISVYTFRATYKLNLDTRNLSHRRAFSEEFKEYSDLLHEEFWKIKGDLSELSGILCMTNSEIGNIFDMYDGRNKPHTKALRHVYADLYRAVTKRFKSQLSWQTYQYIHFELSSLKDLDPGRDFEKKQQRVFPFFKKKEVWFWNRGLISSESFAEEFRELTRSIDANKYQSIDMDVMRTCKRLEEFMIQMKMKCLESYELLDSGIGKNSLQEFKLHESPSLHTRYVRYQCLMEFIYQSNLSDLNSQMKIPYPSIGRTIYFGANIDMINHLINETIFSFKS